ncbi:hypothetical protein FACS1894186_3970 [Alphaproteobacteria bacterium]|nr:hypothetical protein FACS1894186_3970 [Alphaproteobacteria bacterium]
MAWGGFTRAAGSGLLRIEIDAEKFRRRASPVYNPWLLTAPLLVGGLLSLGVIVGMGSAVGVALGVAILAGAAAFHRLVYLRLVDESTTRGVRARMLSGIEAFEEIWSYGGVLLRLAGSPKVGVGQGGDWQAFIALNFPDLMTADEALPAPPSLP